MLRFEGLCLPRFGFQVPVDLRLVGVIAGKSRMDLRLERGRLREVRRGTLGASDKS